MISHRPPTLWEKIKIGLFYLIPHHIVSRLTFFLMRLETRLKNPLINLYIKFFNVDMSEAEFPYPEDYSTFNDFFTRALKDGARSIHDDPRTLIAPCDGTVLELGDIKENALVQAKGEYYSLPRLFGCNNTAELFAHGKFCTIYLAPNDYHRIHIPSDGQLLSMVHIPGRLFSISPYVLKVIPQLYNKNERVSAIFETPLGTIAIVMVAAINVGCIETAWQGIITPTNERSTRFSYTTKASPEVHLKRGEEMGRFNLGSTIVLLTANPNIHWNPKFSSGSRIVMGEELACRIDSDN